MHSTRPGEETDGCRDCGAFFIDATGAFGPGEIIVQWSAQRRTSSDLIERLIEQAWREELASAAKFGRDLFNGNLCRLIDWSSAEGKMSLTLGPATFKEFIGTNTRHPDLRYRFGPEALANPLGVSAALVSNDGFILLGRRSNRVAVYPNSIHPIGGIMDFTEPMTSIPNPFDVMLRELDEETSLSGDAVQGIFCLGMVRDRLTFQPELVFDVATRCDVQAILASAADAADAHEHTELVAVGNNPAAVVGFIERNHAEMTPLATATLLLHGLHHWGCGWFTTARGYLGGTAPGTCSPQ
jgi:8-oxo-dGTP pyrophosphatase MutT (NUDIX family)